MALVHRHANEFCPVEEQLISLCGDKNIFRPIYQKYVATGPFPVDHGKHFVTVWLSLKRASLYQTLNYYSNSPLNGSSGCLFHS